MIGRLKQRGRNRTDENDTAELLAALRAVTDRLAGVVENLDQVADPPQNGTGPPHTETEGD